MVSDGDDNKVGVSESSQFASETIDTVSESTEHISESSQYVSELDVSETTDIRF